MPGSVTSIDTLCQTSPKHGPPLIKWSQKLQPYRLNDLTSHKREALKTLEKKLISLPGSALPRCDGCFTVDKEACDKQNLCVLLQGQEEGSGKAVPYWSLAATPGKRTYHKTQREFIAVP